MPRRALATALGIAVALLVVASAGGYWWYQNTTSYEFKGGTWEPAQPAPALDLTDQQRASFSLQQTHGKVTFVFFGYTHCPDFCPTTLLEVQQVKHLLGNRADDVEVVFVSVDPERDTPERMAQFLAFFDERIIGLSGTPEQTEDIKRAWGIVGTRESPDASGNYLVSHTTSLFAIDPDGNLAVTWAYGTSPEDIASDVEHLL